MLMIDQIIKVTQLFVFTILIQQFPTHNSTHDSLQILGLQDCLARKVVKSRRIGFREVIEASGSLQGEMTENFSKKEGNKNAEHQEERMNEQRNSVQPLLQVKKKREKTRKQKGGGQRGHLIKLNFSSALAAKKLQATSFFS